MADTQVTVFARHKAKPGREDQLKQIFIDMVGKTRKEAGCINYDLHQSPDDPAEFRFYENWTSKKHLDDHLSSPHLKSFFAIADDILAEPPEIKILKRLA